LSRNPEKNCHSQHPFKKVVIIRRNDEAIHHALILAINIAFLKIGKGYHMNKPSCYNDAFERFVPINARLSGKLYHLVYLYWQNCILALGVGKKNKQAY